MRVWLVELGSSTRVHVAAAALVMGSWAAFANLSHGWSAAVTAGLVQAAASAFVTYWLKTMLEAGSARLDGASAFVIPPLVASATVLALLVGAHELARTRELWHTIAIPYAASFTYAWVYSALIAYRSGEPRGDTRLTPNATGPIDSSDLRASAPTAAWRDRSGVSDGNAARRQHAVIVPHGSDEVAGAEYIQGVAVESTGAFDEIAPEQPHPTGAGTEVP